MSLMTPESTTGLRRRGARAAVETATSVADRPPRHASAVPPPTLLAHGAVPSVVTTATATATATTSSTASPREALAEAAPGTVLVVPSGTTVFHGTPVHPERWYRDTVPSVPDKDCGCVSFSLTSTGSPKCGTGRVVVTYTLLTDVTVVKCASKGAFGKQPGASAQVDAWYADAELEIAFHPDTAAQVLRITDVAEPGTSVLDSCAIM